MEYNLTYVLDEKDNKKKKLKKKVKEISYDKNDTELKALLERRNQLVKDKMTSDKKAKLKAEINNLEGKKNPSLKNRIANFLSPQANDKRKHNVQKARQKGANGMKELNDALAPLMDL